MLSYHIRWETTNPSSSISERSKRDLTVLYNNTISHFSARAPCHAMQLTSGTVSEVFPAVTSQSADYCMRQRVFSVKPTSPLWIHCVWLRYQLITCVTVALDGLAQPRHALLSSLHVSTPTNSMCEMLGHALSGFPAEVTGVGGFHLGWRLACREKKPTSSLV